MTEAFTLKQSLYAADGHRKYLNQDERLRFSATSSRFGNADPLICSVCETLLWTGCRISEVLALKTSDVHVRERVVVIRTLKQGKQLRFRQIPVPEELVDLLRHVHDHDDPQSRMLWPWHRVTAYHHVKQVMKEARIEGIHACPKGLRHSFGVHCMLCGVSIQSIQRWLGHSDISTTLICTQVVGAEERRIAQRCWGGIRIAPDLRIGSKKWQQTEPARASE